MRRPLAQTSVRDALDSALIALEAAGCDTPRLDAELLLAAAMGVDRAAIVADPARELEPDAARRFIDYAARRREREPVAYILGTKGFRSIELAVDPRVLIPRPETEHLVEAVLDLPARRPGLRRRHRLGSDRARAGVRAPGPADRGHRRERGGARRRARERRAARAAGGAPPRRPARGRRRRARRDRVESARTSRTAPSWRRRSCATSPRSRCAPAPTASTSSAGCCRPPARRARGSSRSRSGRGRRTRWRRSCARRGSGRRTTCPRSGGDRARARGAPPLRVGRRRRTTPDATAFEATIRAGGVAVFPADTVYGLACDPGNPAAGRQALRPEGAGARQARRGDVLRPRPRAGRAARARRPHAPRRSRTCSPAPSRSCSPTRPGATRSRAVPIRTRSDCACPTSRRSPPSPSPVLQSSANHAGGADARRLGDVPRPIRDGADLVLDGGELPGTPSTVVDLRRYERDGAWSVLRSGALAPAQVATVLG